MLSLARFALSLFAALAPQTKPATDRPLDASEIEQDVRAVAKLLGHADANVREHAVEGLAELGAAIEYAFPTLLELLPRSDEARAAVHDLIAKLGPRAAALLPGLLDYGRSAEPAALPFVVELLHQLAPDVRGSEAFLRDAFARSNGATKLFAAKTLLLIEPDDAARQFLASGLRDGSVEQDDEVQECLARGGLDAELATWLVAQIAENIGAARDWAEQLLQKVDARSAPAMAVLVAALASEDQDVRTYAAEALGRIGPAAEAATAALAPLLQKEDSTERTRVRYALARINPNEPRAVAWVLSGAERGDDNRATTIAMLTELDEAIVARELNRRFDASDADAKKEFLATVAELRNATIDSGAELDASTASEMLRLLRERKLASTLTSLLVRAASGGDVNVRDAALEFLLSLEVPAEECSSAIAAAFNDPDPTVRGHAAVILSGSRLARALPRAPHVKALREALASDDETLVADVATALCERLTAEPAAKCRPAALENTVRFDVDALAYRFLDQHDSKESLPLTDGEMAALLETARTASTARAELATRILREYDGRVSAALVPKFIAALADPADYVRVMAADLLDEDCAAPAIAIPALIQALGDVDDVANAAVDSLVQFGPAVVPGLIQALNDGSRRRRLAALRTLAALKSDARPAAKALAGLIDDGDEEVRSAAAAALLNAVYGDDLRQSIANGGH